MTATAAPRGGRLLLLYPVLAAMAFPTLGVLVAGTRALMVTLDVFDDGGALPRLAIATRDWTAHGLTVWDPYLTAGNAFLGQFARRTPIRSHVSDLLAQEEGPQTLRQVVRVGDQLPLWAGGAAKVLLLEEIGRAHV